MLSSKLTIPKATIESVPAVDYVDIEDHIRGWKKQKANTGSDTDGLTFSHYKAASKERDISKFDANIRSLPYKYGFSPKNWQTITDVEILEKTGVHDIEKMRTIQLMNAEFNMNNKKLGKDMMRVAERNKTIPREQYG